MSEENEIKIEDNEEEKTFEEILTDATKLLDKTIDKVTKGKKLKSDKKEKIEDKPVISEELREGGIESVVKAEDLRNDYLNYLESVFIFINPLLKRVKVKEFTDQEIKDFVMSGTNLIDSYTKTSSEKIEKYIKRMSHLPFWVKFGSVVWKMFVNRYDDLKALQKIQQKE